MNIDIPVQISFNSFCQNIFHIATAHSHVMFESILTDIFHKRLQIIHLGYCYTTIHSVWIISQVTFTQIRFDTTLRIICRDTEECKITLFYFTVNGTESVYTFLLMENLKSSPATVGAASMRLPSGTQ